jgi:hypothetical protein
MARDAERWRHWGQWAVMNGESPEDDEVPSKRKKRFCYSQKVAKTQRDPLKTESNSQTVCLLLFVVVSLTHHDS